MADDGFSLRSRLEGKRKYWMERFRRNFVGKAPVSISKGKVIANRRLNFESVKWMVGILR